jgi:colanic acid/amylovoran biosynthesis protein
VDLIAVREKSAAPRLLAELGVDPSRICLTGDDAIELAYEARIASLGSAIGISLRIAHYTELEQHHQTIVGAILKDSATRYGAQLIPLPISQSIHEQDATVVRRLMAGHNDPLNYRRRFETPLEIIKRTGRCRLVVAGTFHGAVFALAQGIPAVGLAKSKHYLNKFHGLADQFGSGCQVILLDDEQFQEKLATAIDAAWESAEQTRSQLLEAAQRQIQSGRAGYRRLYELVASRSPGL